NRIQEMVKKAFQPLYLELHNESFKHSVPPNSETHFKLLLVSPLFNGQSRVERQRQVYQVLDEEFKSGLHALTIRALAPEEWKAEASNEFVSPDCQGGSKKN